jgi:hypothetical protein
VEKTTFFSLRRIDKSGLVEEKRIAQQGAVFSSFNEQGLHKYIPSY